VNGDPQEGADVGMGPEVPSENEVLHDAFLDKQRSHADATVVNTAVDHVIW
jgi:hypothetical protein